MNNLTTRKIVLGMLMTLVLAFSVQGTADALEFRDHSSTDGDLKTVFPDGEFKIKFSVSLKSNTSIKDTTGNLIDEDGNRIDSSGYFILLDTSDSDEDGNIDEFLRTPVDGADKPTTSKRYHYSDEAVMITVTGPAELKEVGSRDISGKTHTLSEMGKDENKLSSSITLTLLADNTGPAPIQITIEDVTDEDDLLNGTADHAPDFAFTVYMVHFETAPPAVPSGSHYPRE